MRYLCRKISSMAKIAINIATGSLQQEEMIVGIDLGTTNSLVAIIHPESRKPVALQEHNSSLPAGQAGSLVPSVVHFSDNGSVLVGEEAKKFLVDDPARTIFSAKRLMGKTYNDVKNNTTSLAYKIIDDENRLVKVQVGDQFYSPVDLSSLILKELKKQAEHILKTPVSKAVITVPAYFNDAQRQATRDAGKLAGLDVLRIINEPTAASLAYGFGLHKDENKTIAVYDLGGGTFDISILHISNGIFEVLSTNGDTYLGGDDLDNALVDHWIEVLGLTGSAQEKTHRQMLRLKAEEAKKQLSTQDAYESAYEGMQLSVTRSVFESRIGPILERTITSCSQALKDAGLAKADIQEVVMVGGSTRVPLVKKRVSEFFGKPVNDTVNPDEVVALGAAIQADILAGNTKDVLLLDVTPLSLGLETMGGLMDVLLPRNSKIPTKAARQYTTYKDGQSGMKIAVYQGERDMVKDNRRLAEFNLTGIPAMPAGLPKVEVSFLINADGILVVKAKELRSGIEQSIEVKPQYGLTDEDVEKMLLDSMTHAKEDMEVRALTEAKTEAEQLLQTTEKFIQKNFKSLTPQELQETSLAMQALQLSLDMNDKNLVQAKTEELNQVSRPYAERLMDEAIQQTMKGNKIDQL
ncbi:MAG: Fe-S protein assembly chaperone HscA [Chitinophagales bacterium]|nr:Fe-S protein assembly chaperone HscA [Chitinophagales bacterium]